MPIQFTELTDLASVRLGGKALAANDEFFAPKQNLLKPEPAAFIAGRFTLRGKWMDGWETRRRRTPGFDWCVVRLGRAGWLRGFDVDTSHFVGNFPESCSIEGCFHEGSRAGALKGSVDWFKILPESPLKGDSHNLFEVSERRPVNHVRLNIFPDGGVARLRVYGEVAPDETRLSKSKEAVDLAAVEHGGLVVAASDDHFGKKQNMIMPGRARNMGDGWETKRRRGPGYDWAILRLGAPGRLEKVEVDTNHFKGNYPDACSIDALYHPASFQSDGLPEAAELAEREGWTEILPRTKLSAHRRHFFKVKAGPATHVRLNIYPDGGVSRFRVYGRIFTP